MPENLGVAKIKAISGRKTDCFCDHLNVDGK